MDSDSPQEVSLQNVIVGTAGHIDHGKTRLVGRLTGVMTDRLPEEKARGISIDLGFAHWDDERFRFGVVDMPGHERFVKNMVAGATGVNLALLVIAADDSVMPQTREHLEIMDLLGIQTGVVVITKIDLVDSDFVELVQAEIEELLVGTFLEGCPMVPVSSETGEGIDELRAVISRLAGTLEWNSSHQLFRLPIDRVFSITGHGTVAAGSALSGEVQAGDMLELLPEQREIRVRSVESYGENIEEGGARQRTAINLAGVKTGEISRGQELATPGFLRPTTRMVVQLKTLSSSPVTLKNRLEVNLHIGTTEVFARVILKDKLLEPGETAYAELRMKEPITAAFGQRFILRRVSPAITIAGGTVVDPFVPVTKRIKQLQEYGAAAGDADSLQRFSFWIAHRDSISDSSLEATWRTGVSPAVYAELIEQLKKEKRVISIGSQFRSVWIHKDRLEVLCGSVMRVIREELERNQPRRSLPQNTFMTACRALGSADLIEAVFGYLLKKKQLVLVGKNMGPADAQVQLTKKQRQIRDELLTTIQDAGLMPPTTKAMAASFDQKISELLSLLNICVEDSLLVRLDDSLHISPTAATDAQKLCADYLQEHGKATMSELREAWGLSRKFSVPLCEYFDQIGVTIRQGDVRIAGPKIGESLFAVRSAD